MDQFVNLDRYVNTGFNPEVMYYNVDDGVENQSKVMLTQLVQNWANSAAFLRTSIFDQPQ